MNTKKYVSLIVALATVGSLAVAIPAFAETNVPGANNGGRFGKGMMNRGEVKKGLGVAGKVTLVSGTTITITSNGNKTTYTVNASSATVTKGNVASTVSSIVVGDQIMVQGTVTGTKVVAKTIRIGGPGKGQPVIQGNGQPVVAGSVTLISGNTISITNKSNVTYTVDASGAKFVVPGVTSPTISNIATGDNLVVQGVINGNSVVASSVIDQKAKTANETENSDKGQKSQGGFMGMMGGIGNFFKQMFGF